MCPRAEFARTGSLCCVPVHSVLSSFLSTECSLTKISFLSTVAAPRRSPRVARGLIRRRCVTRVRARHSARRRRYRPLARHARGWFARLPALARRPRPRPDARPRPQPRARDRQRFGTRVWSASRRGGVGRARVVTSAVFARLSRARGADDARHIDRARARARRPLGGVARRLGAADPSRAMRRDRHQNARVVRSRTRASSTSARAHVDGHGRHELEFEPRL